jgi:hypothetical protein
MAINCGHDLKILSLPAQKIDLNVTTKGIEIKAQEILRKEFHDDCFIVDLSYSREPNSFANG